MSVIDIKQSIVDTLTDEFKIPVILQGTLLFSEAYPDDFFTFWNTDSRSAAFYDGNENETIWTFELNVYSNNPEHVNSYLLTAKSLFRAQGWIIDGKGYDIASDEPTHTGRGIQMIYLEKETQEEENHA